MRYGNEVSFSVLVGKTLTKITGDVGDDYIRFDTSDGEKYALEHRQDCCESVRVEDIIGDLQRLVGDPIVVAEELQNEPEPYTCRDSYTWTFYKLRTVKDTVVIRWLGESNGYYSESVDFVKVK